jgi:hypothetical protein
VSRKALTIGAAVGAGIVRAGEIPDQDAALRELRRVVKSASVVPIVGCG